MIPSHCTYPSSQHHSIYLSTSTPSFLILKLLSPMLHQIFWSSEKKEPITVAVRPQRSRDLNNVLLPASPAYSQSGINVIYSTSLLDSFFFQVWLILNDDCTHFPLLLPLSSFILIVNNIFLCHTYSPFPPSFFFSSLLFFIFSSFLLPFTCPAPQL